MSGQKIWASILSDVKTQISSSTFKTWFAGSCVVDFKEEEGGSVLVVGVRNHFLKEQVENRYLSIIQEAAKKKGLGDTKVSFAVLKASDVNVEPAEAPLFSGEAPTFINSFRKIDNLNPFHTFSNFVVGSSNNLAFMAFSQVSEKPGAVYNPLFIYGETGVGKTHLLQACGNEILNKISDAKVLYVSAEKFTNDYIESLNNRTQQHFRQKYRNVDTLIVDDIQFLSGKESTQDEFFYTFNELYLSGRQVIIASDRHPKDLGRLKDRLVSRFLGGMTVDIGRPDLELKIAILRAKCKEKGVLLEDEILAYIAESCQGSVRELEGLLVQVLSITRLTSGKITLEEIVGIIDRNKVISPNPISPQKVISVVSRHFKIPKEDLCGSRRKAHFVKARQVLMFLLRKDLGMGLDAIGDLLGGKDHSTVIYGIDKIQGLLDKNQAVRDEISRIRSSFQQK